MIPGRRADPGRDRGDRHRRGRRAGGVAGRAVPVPAGERQAAPGSARREPVLVRQTRRRAGDEVVVAVKRLDPEPWVEIHCHGGRRVVRWVVEQFVRAGCTEVEWQSLPKPTRGHGWACDSRALEPLTKPRPSAPRRSCSTSTTAHSTEPSRTSSPPSTARPRRASIRLQALADFAPVGRHLVRALAGRRSPAPPNVGKSSLVNALAGYQRTVVAPVAGTTRDVVTATVAFDGWPVELADTAGLRDAAESLEAEGIGQARRHLAEADVVVWVLDASAPDPVWPADPDERENRPGTARGGEQDRPPGPVGSRLGSDRASALRGHRDGHTRTRFGDLPLARPALAPRPVPRSRSPRNWPTRSKPPADSLRPAKSPPPAKPSPPACRKADPMPAQADPSSRVPPTDDTDSGRRATARPEGIPALPRIASSLAPVRRRCTPRGAGRRNGPGRLQPAPDRHRRPARPDQPHPRRASPRLHQQPRLRPPPLLVRPRARSATCTSTCRRGTTAATAFPAMIWMHGIGQDEKDFLDLVRTIRRADAVRSDAAVPDRRPGRQHPRPGVAASTTAASTSTPRPAGSRTTSFRTCGGSSADTSPSARSGTRHILAGASMGGFGAYNLGFKHRHEFGQLVGVMPPSNLRYVDCHGRYFADYDPNCVSYRDELRPREMIGRFYGVVRVQSRQLLGPLLGRRNSGSDRLHRRREPDRDARPPTTSGRASSACSSGTGPRTSSTSTPRWSTSWTWPAAAGYARPWSRSPAAGTTARPGWPCSRHCRRWTTEQLGQYTPPGYTPAVAGTPLGAVRGPRLMPDPVYLPLLGPVSVPRRPANPAPGP